MIKINLLPYVEAKKKESAASQIVIIAASFVLFGVVIAAVFLYMMFSIAGLEKDLKDSEAKLAALTKVVGEVENIKQEKEIVEKKLSIIKGLEENKLYPIKMLDQFATLIPSKEIWLDKVSEVGTDMNIDGMGRDGIAVAKFMKTLETASFINSVELIASKQKEVAGVKLQQFSLKCSTKRKK